MPIRPNGTVPGDPAIPDVHYQSDALAKLIVDLWLSEADRNLVVNRPRGGGGAEPPANPGRGLQRADEVLAGRGLYIAQAVIVGEEFVGAADYEQSDSDEITFVLPVAPNNAALRPREQLLETARILMAVTPHGI